METEHFLLHLVAYIFSNHERSISLLCIDPRKGKMVKDFTQRWGVFFFNIKSAQISQSSEFFFELGTQPAKKNSMSFLFFAFFWSGTKKSPKSSPLFLNFTSSHRFCRNQTAWNQPFIGQECAKPRMGLEEYLPTLRILRPSNGGV